MTQRLPIPGSDDDTWGAILNGFLGVSLNSDGTLQTAALTAAGGEISSNKGVASGYASLNSSGLVPTSQLGTGTASSTNYLRGDGTWVVPATGVTLDTTASDIQPLGTRAAGSSGLAADAKHVHAMPTAAQVGALSTTNNLSDVTDAGSSRANIHVPVLTPAAAVSVSNISLTAPGATFDGYTMNSGDLLLLTAQTTASQNGLWTWTGGSTTLTRPTEFASGATMKGRTVEIQHGTSYGGTTWVLTTATAGIVIDTASQSWSNPLDSRYPQSGAYVGVATTVVATAGSALTITWSSGTPCTDVTLSSPVCVLTMPAPVANTSASLHLIIRQGTTGGRKVQWPANVLSIGAIPALTTTANGTDEFDLFSDDGSTWVLEGAQGPSNSIDPVSVSGCILAVEAMAQPLFEGSVLASSGGAATYLTDRSGTGNNLSAPLATVYTNVTASSAGVSVSSFTGSGVLNIAAVAGFSSSGGTITVLCGGSTVTITYTGVSSLTLTGCTTVSGQGILETGDLVYLAQTVFHAAGMPGGTVVPFGGTRPYVYIPAVGGAGLTNTFVGGSISDYAVVLAQASYGLSETYFFSLLTSGTNIDFTMKNLYGYTAYIYDGGFHGFSNGGWLTSGSSTVGTGENGPHVLSVSQGANAVHGTTELTVRADGYDASNGAGPYNSITGVAAGRTVDTGAPNQQNFACMYVVSPCPPIWVLKGIERFAAGQLSLASVAASI